MYIKVEKLSMNHLTSIIDSSIVQTADEHFRSKDFQISAEIFERAMLYIPYDIESRNLRAKGFRVLCLCYMGLSQLDRAQEYINEAEKVHSIN